MNKEQYDERVAAERERQEEKHQSFHELYDKVPHDWFVILVEEIGEVSKAINEGNEENMIEELIQCAAVIKAWLTDEE